MLLRDSIGKTKNFFQKTLLNFKSVLFGGYQKLPKPLLLNPFSCTTIGKTKNHQTDRFHSEFCNEWECDLEEARKKKKKKKKNSMIIASKEPMNEGDASSGRFLKIAKKSPLLTKQEEGSNKEEKKMVSFRLDKKGDQYCSHAGNADGYALAQKMQQLDMMDAGDVEHVLDVEEALHYYSRLRSPVYLDIVDKFFMDMYSEFSVPQPSASINNSKRRLRSIRL
ncbi:hypothetical protein Dsin_013747 [Dipteronia sinensis]|uniref:OVATE domain-containing protein n=1 Tax=Dipteronia sinensis TaxID=43782 RepID=A0AAE0ALN4_9ROSI|nr:hypothetical protein Dsin_013747 [Dipteronia sinensis]